MGRVAWAICSGSDAFCVKVSAGNTDDTVLLRKTNEAGVEYVILCTTVVGAGAKEIVGCEAG